MMNEYFSDKIDFPFQTGQKIRIIRKRKGKSAKDIAAACQITEPAVRNYEQGIRQLSDERINDMANALDVNPSALKDHNIESISDIIHTLFELESAGIVSPFAEDGKGTCGVHSTHPLLSKAIEAWLVQHTKRQNEEISETDYAEWKDAFPNQAAAIEITDDDIFNFGETLFNGTERIKNYPYYILVTLLKLKQQFIEHCTKIREKLASGKAENVEIAFSLMYSDMVVSFDQEIMRLVSEADILERAPEIKAEAEAQYRDNIELYGENIE